MPNSADWLALTRQLRAASFCTTNPVSRPATVAPGNGGVNPAGAVVEVGAAGGSGAAQLALGTGGVATTQSVTLCVPPSARR